MAVPMEEKTTGLCGREPSMCGSDQPTSAGTRASIERPQRAAALRIIHAYRTMFDEYSLLLAFVLPAGLLGMEGLKIRAQTLPASTPGVPHPSKMTIKREYTTITSREENPDVYVSLRSAG